jgi:hypothetical protein
MMLNDNFCKTKDKVNEGQETLMNTGLYALVLYCIVALSAPHYNTILKIANGGENV